MNNSPSDNIMPAYWTPSFAFRPKVWKYLDRIESNMQSMDVSTEYKAEFKFLQQKHCRRHPCYTVKDVYNLLLGITKILFWAKTYKSPSVALLDVSSCPVLR